MRPQEPMLSHFHVISSSLSNLSWKQNPCAALRLYNSTHAPQTFPNTLTFCFHFEDITIAFHLHAHSSHY